MKLQETPAVVPDYEKNEESFSASGGNAAGSSLNLNTPDSNSAVSARSNQVLGEEDREVLTTDLSSKKIKMNGGESVIKSGLNPAGRMDTDSSLNSCWCKEIHSPHPTGDVI